MGTTLNRTAYQRLIDEDLAWLEKQPRSLEREHIKDIVRLSPSREYVNATTTPPNFTEQYVTPEQIVLGTARLDSHFRKWLVEQLTSMGDSRLRWEPSPRYVADFTEQARQLVNKLKNANHRDWEPWYAAIASFAAEAATQGQDARVERLQAQLNGVMNCLAKSQQELERVRNEAATAIVNGLARDVLEVCKLRGWSLHWTHRGAYLHLESSELIEAIRGKHGDPLKEAGDVLLVLMSITENQGIPFDAVLEQAKMTANELKSKPHYAGEEYHDGSR